MDDPRHSRPRRHRLPPHPRRPRLGHRGPHQEWFEAGACDGFWVSIDINEDGIDTFVDEVGPLLQERGLFHHDYEGTTLRDHLDAPAQYGIDPRIAVSTDCHDSYRNPPQLEGSPST